MADRVGQHLGEYRLVRLLGRGGFAEVYLGEHLHERTLAAVKVLQTRVESREDLMKGFIKEASAFFRLKHPNIVQLLGFDITTDDIPFLVMEYAPNGTLRQRHPRGTRLPLATVVNYVTPVAAALQYAHNKGLIHRDVKPENMLLGSQQEVLLSDFGIATIAHHTATLRVEAIAGTTLYMAPEAFEGKPRPSSDQYSLGIVNYEWLTGNPPFTEGNFIQLGYQHAHILPPPLREKNPSISPMVEQVVLTALLKDPKQRFATVQAFATALEQAYQAEQELAAAPTLRATPPAPEVPPTIEVSPPPGVPTLPTSSPKEVKPPAPVVSPPKSSPMPVASDIVTPPSPPPGRSRQKAEPEPLRKAEPVSEPLPSKVDTPKRSSPPQPIAATPPSRSPAVSPPPKAAVSSASPRTSRRRGSALGWAVFYLTLLVVAGLAIWWVFSPLYPGYSIKDDPDRHNGVINGLLCIAFFVFGLFFAAGAIDEIRTSSKSTGTRPAAAIVCFLLGGIIFIGFFLSHH